MASDLPVADPLVVSARALWSRLAGVPVTFPAAAGITVVRSPASLLCPPGWAGVVVIGGAGIATAPDPHQEQLLRAGLARLTSASGTPADAGTVATDPERVRAALPVAEVLGPATLAYLDGADLTPAGTATVDRLPADRAGLGLLLGSVPADEAGESGLDEIESDVFVVRRHGRVVAAGGWHRWPDTAHLCVLTATDVRGQGLARTVAYAAARAALAEGLLPQWRARPEPSRRVARALGFRELGTQLSVRLDTGAHAWTAVERPASAGGSEPMPSDRP